MHNYFTAAPAGSVRITGDHGYRIEGDTAFINAELDIVDDVETTDWALQLWACDNPHSSGPIVGVKVAEARVELAAGTQPCRVEVATFAALPAQRRDYSMVLVLASGAPGAFEQVHDFANYPVRQSFDVPHLDGTLSYAIQTDSVLLNVERVTNPRPYGTLSGTLALELWAKPAYSGAAFNGSPQSRVTIGQLAGQGTLEHLGVQAAFTTPPAGEWQIALALSEWTDAAGFVIRDFCNFSAPLRTTPPPSQEATTSPRPTPSPREAAPPTQEEIALAAYYRHLARGDQPGSQEDDWLAAERGLRQLQ
jgi:hypothetical protein